MERLDRKKILTGLSSNIKGGDTKLGPIGDITSSLIGFVTTITLK